MPSAPKRTSIDAGSRAASSPAVLSPTPSKRARRRRLRTPERPAAEARSGIGTEERNSRSVPGSTAQSSTPELLSPRRAASSATIGIRASPIWRGKDRTSAVVLDGKPAGELPTLDENSPSTSIAGRPRRSAQTRPRPSTTTRGTNSRRNETNSGAGPAPVNQTGLQREAYLILDHRYIDLRPRTHSQPLDIDSQGHRL